MADKASVTSAILTFNRPQLLIQALEAINQQDFPVKRIVIIDNHSEQKMKGLTQRFPTVDYQYLDENLGGAGGFAAAIEEACTHPCDFLWLMDDDGMPGNPDCLGQLVKIAQQQQADVTAPAVLNIENPAQLAFPVRTRHTTHFHYHQISDQALIFDFAHLFNGVLISRDLVSRIGLPDKRLFIRGDEVDYLLRAKKHGAKVVMNTAAKFLHPSSDPEIFPVFWGLFYATYPQQSGKRFYQFRNRGYIFFTHKMYHYLIFDLFRYSYFFLIGRKLDFTGLYQWLKLTVTGMCMPQPK